MRTRHTIARLEGSSAHELGARWWTRIKGTCTSWHRRVHSIVQQRVRAQVRTYPNITRVALAKLKPTSTTVHHHNKLLTMFVLLFSPRRSGAESAVLLPVPALVFCGAVLDQLAFTTDLSADRLACRYPSAPIPAHRRRALASAARRGILL